MVVTTDKIEESGAIASASFKAQDEYLMTLQNLLATEGAEKEASYADLYRWKRAIDSHRRQLIALVHDGEDRNGENVWRRIQDEVAKFENTIKSLQMSKVHTEDGETSPRRTYEILRASLNETQRRCESLNSDMSAQQESNAQLVTSLNTAKDNNKELLEQIQQQTAAITALTQERIADEQKIDALLRQHRQEEEMWKQDGYRRLQVLRDQGEERYGAMYSHLTSKLKYVEARASAVKNEFTGIKTNCLEQRTQMVAMKEGFNGQFNEVLARTLVELEDKEKKHQ